MIEAVIHLLDEENYIDWKVTGGDKANTKYSLFDQFKKENVHLLELV